MENLSYEQKEQIKNCFEVVRRYQEKNKNKPNQTILVRKRLVEKNNDNDIRKIKRLLGRVKHLTPEDRKRVSEILDILEQRKEHNRGRGRGR